MKVLTPADPEDHCTQSLQRWTLLGQAIDGAIRPEPPCPGLYDSRRY